jgi:sulfur transfer complex TusBCD TusB component (DsrH family)
MPKILNIVETAYRATLEEQDDTVLWLTQMLKNAGADIAILLRANAVNYAVRGQDASGLTFGELRMAHPPEIDRDLEKMLAKGIPVYLLQEDAVDRGLSDQDLIPGIQKILRKDLPELVDRHDQVWHW